MKKLLLFVCLATLFACKKVDKAVPPAMEGTWESDGQISTGPVTMFTSNQIIRDTAAVNAYIRRKWGTTPFYPGTNADTMSYRQTLIFQGDSVTVKSNAGSATTTCDVKLNDPGVSSFIERDSIKGVHDRNQEPLTCDNIALKIQLDLPDFDCKAIPGSSEYYCTARQVWPFMRIENRILRPLLRYTFNRTGAGTACGFSQFDIPIFFRQSVSAEFQAGDTLLVQIGTYLLYKK